MLTIKQLIFKNRKAFTITEALLATVIVGLAVVPIGMLFYVGYSYVGQVRETSIAMQAIQEEVETIRNMDYDDILAIGSDFEGAGFGRLEDAVGEVVIDDPLGEANIRRVTVTVSWTSTVGREMSKSMATLVTNGGINKQ
ncbi:hypothetical protein ACFL42_01855 [Candidatus Omnitrophota bacterium]